MRETPDALAIVTDRRGFVVAVSERRERIKPAARREWNRYGYGKPAPTVCWIGGLSSANALKSVVRPRVAAMACDTTCRIRCCEL